MSPEHSGFFSDPKVIIAILALVISLAGLLWTLANQFEQNRRWDVLNMGYIELTKPAFTVFRTISRKEFKSLYVGYESKTYGSENSIDEVRFIHLVRIRNKETGAQITNTDPTITLTEVEQELGKLAERPKAIELTRVYRPIFFFSNSGKTEVRDLTFEISHTTYDGAGWMIFLRSGAPANILPGQEFNITKELEVPLNSPMPEKIPFKIEIDYRDIRGTAHKETIKRVWYSEGNDWKYD